MSLAIATTAHPGCYEFLGAWAASITGQLADEPVLIAVDSVASADVSQAIGPGLDEYPALEILPAPQNSSFGAVRAIAWQRAKQLGATHLLSLDGDDLLMDNVLDRARHVVRHETLPDVLSFGLRLSDSRGRDLGIDFPGWSPADPAHSLPWCNHFGLGNSLWRMDALLDCGDIPGAAAIVDWWLATAIWLRGGTLSFDPEPAILYRQHDSVFGDQSKGVTAERLQAAVDAVCIHHELVAQLPGLPERCLALETARARCARFAEALELDSTTMDAVVEALNNLPGPLPWWGLVAHPDLDSIWNL